MMENLTPSEKDAVKASIFLAVILAAMIAYYDFYILAEDIKRNTTQVEELKNQITERKERLYEMKQMVSNRVEVEQKQQILERIVKRLPKNEDDLGFYNAFGPVCQATHFEYTELSKMPPTTRTSYTEIPYRIIGKSRFHDFGQFLNMIEENPDRLMRVKGFTIDNQTQRPSIHPVTVEIASFTFSQIG